MNKEEYKELPLPVGETATGNLRMEQKIKIHYPYRSVRHRPVN